MTGKHTKKQRRMWSRLERRPMESMHLTIRILYQVFRSLDWGALPRFVSVSDYVIINCTLTICNHEIPWGWPAPTHRKLSA